jgi:hypothetical protein
MASGRQAWCARAPASSAGLADREIGLDDPLDTSAFDGLCAVEALPFVSVATRTPAR